MRAIIFLITIAVLISSQGSYAQTARLSKQPTPAECAQIIEHDLSSPMTELKTPDDYKKYWLLNQCYTSTLAKLKSELNAAVNSEYKMGQIIEFGIPIAYIVSMVGVTLTSGSLIRSAIKQKSIVEGWNTFFASNKSKVYLSLFGVGVVSYQGQKLLIHLKRADIAKLRERIEKCEKQLSAETTLLQSYLGTDLYLGAKH